MDEEDYYYRDIVDGVSDAEIDSSSEDDDDTSDNYRRLFNLGKHLSSRDKEVLLLGDATVSVGRDSSLSALALSRKSPNPSSILAENGDNVIVDFEREMEIEASRNINGLHVKLDDFCSSIPASTEIAAHSSRPRSNLDNFISVSLPESTDSFPFVAPVASTSRTREQENDELLYDPDEDDRNEIWAKSHRSRHRPSTTIGNLPKISTAAGTSSSKCAQPKNKRSSESDATLNCPCCLTLLCLDCQRHDIYKTQYRAMFVHNCRVELSQKLLYKDKQEQRNQYRRSKKHRQQQLQKSEPEGNRESSSRDFYYPVHCSNCNTQVALYDCDQVYHFFSVLASH